VALTIVFSLFHSRNSEIVFEFSVRYDKQLKDNFLCEYSHTSMNSRRSNNPCEFKNLSSLLRLPKIEFQRQLRRLSPSKIYRLEVAMFLSFKKVITISIPCFSLKSFLFFLQFWHRLARIVKQSYLI
jgi:hypothetical protein